MAGRALSTHRASLRHVFFAIFAFFFAGTLSYLYTANPEQSSATVVGFNAGNIINDYTMSNYTTMSETDIQNFLKSKNPCNDTKLYQKDPYPHLEYHIKDGHFVCMADETFGPGLELGNPDGETAAHIIYEVSQTYKINPQVLLVLLEKEQGLITDTWPNAGQYKTATGYGCPDTAACDSQYFGLRNQLENAAGMFRKLLDGGGTNLYPIGWHNIAYKDRAPWCGSAYIHVDNIATGILYTYTPYTPNQAALDAGTGLGDACSAYGNRNFYHFFTEWFGSTQVEPGTVSSSTIPDGVYEILSGVNTTYALDGSDKSGADGANVKLVTRQTTSNAQKWQFTYSTATGTYQLVNLASGRALDVENGSTISGTNVQLYQPHSTCAQSWRISKTSNNNYTFATLCGANAVLDVYSGLAKDNANVWIYASNGTMAQQWRIIKVDTTDTPPTIQPVTPTQTPSKTPAQSPEQPSSSPASTTITSDTVPSGTYEILSKLDNNFAIEAAGGSTNNGTNIQLYTRNHSAAQKWQITRSADGTYTIHNATSGKSLDVENAATQSGTNVHLYMANPSCAQKWKISKNSNNTYTIFSTCNTSNVIDAASGRSANGTNIWVYTKNGTAAQQWVLVSHGETGTAADNSTSSTTSQKPSVTSLIADGTYIISSKINDNFAIEAAGGSTSNGTNIQLYAKNGTAAQQWIITHLSDEIYTIINATSGKSLDVENAATQSGINVHLYMANPSCAQKWKATKNSNGSFTFASTCNTNNVLDAQNGAAANGVNIWIYTKNGTAAQQWMLTKL